LLRARDLSAEVENEAARRTAHLRAVHDTWGVVLGFSLRGTSRAVEVGPGFGYDRCGRELVSAAAVLVPKPATDGRYDLALGLGCGLEYRWREPGRACDDELVLARFAVESGALSDPDLSVRRVCRRRRFRLAADSKQTTVQAMIEVSTTAAGFRSEPLYFATLELTEPPKAMLGPLLDIRDSSKSGFKLLLYPADDSWAEGADATVHWLGVEPLPLLDLPNPTEEE
jgi:hypothetical protein